MEYREIISNLEKIDQFTEWKKENQESFLAHFIKMEDNSNQPIHQVGYCINEKVTTFVINDDSFRTIEIMPAADIFKKPNTTISKLELNKCKISTKEAEEIINKIQDEKYINYVPIKKMMILQKIDEFENPIWNTTFFSATVKILNIKIDAYSGEVLSENLIDLIQKMEPGLRNN
jgi:hypothetical protein